VTLKPVPPNRIEAAELVFYSSLFVPLNTGMPDLSSYFRPIFRSWWETTTLPWSSDPPIEEKSQVVVSGIAIIPAGPAWALNPLKSLSNPGNASGRRRASPSASPSGSLEQYLSRCYVAPMSSVPSDAGMSGLQM
jgi:hypothetical protein